MRAILSTALLWFAAIGCGLMGGIYFAFSTFIMRAFATLDPAQASAAMNAINAVILRSPFMPLFWATTLSALALVVLAAPEWQTTPGRLALAGGLVYLLGMFGCTVAFNVPLNDQLAAASGDAAAWQRYLAEWTRWNHLRTLASTLACAGFVWALVARR
ncbi:MAG TPA: anthrone oxygenase family protein [Tahibacter sp.]|uniref:anthrone oxygenase family protein n=1 Tax=Tahibacter sp. TaxID=2056211 RepID=UPI002C20179B|nr:anthrone oxygenase family protein [Tahibacter sp.]HSX59109.1 anthrone oxygenase family protein [Tahibacter sp.]